MKPTSAHLMAGTIRLTAPAVSAEDQEDPVMMAATQATAEEAEVMMAASVDAG